jgi:nucleotide-binding universal stress UspA family protein
LYGGGVFARIVVGTDGSATAAEAVRVAIGLARMVSAELHLVRACQPPALAMAAVPEVGAAALPADVIDAMRQDAKDNLAQLAEELTATGLKVHTHVTAEAPGPALCQTANAVDADLLVVGNRGMQGARRLLGSVPNHVTHHAPCAVLVVRTV